MRVETYYYIELLVTTRTARGRGVGSGLVREIQSVRGVVVCVATSQGTSAILRGLGWREWRRIEPRHIAPILTGHFFTDLNIVTSFVYDKYLVTSYNY